METVLRKSVAPYYGVAATWVLYALVFDLYRPHQFLIAAALSPSIEPKLPCPSTSGARKTKSCDKRTMASYTDESPCG